MLHNHPMNKIIVAALFLILIIVTGSLFFYQKSDNNPAPNTSEVSSLTTDLQSQQETVSSEDATINYMDASVTELKFEDEVVGTGDTAEAGKNVTVHYTGTLITGEKFDSSVDRGQPLSFVLGAGRVIQGWDQGVVGMKVGGKRKLTIPPSLGYGEQGTGPIPPSATLIFEVELLKVE